MHSTDIQNTLDPHSHDLLVRVGQLALSVPPAELTLARRRALAHEANVLLLPDEGELDVPREDLAIELPQRRLPARLYRPAPGANLTGAQDVLLVFFHGGGWVVGDLDTHDNGCAFLAQQLGCTLLSVEYRKAPEHPFPAPCDDAAAAYAWAASRMADWGCTRLAVAGDSAGGHLAAHAMFATPGVETAAALLFYPVADMDFQNASYTHAGTGPGLTSVGMYWFWEQLLGHARISDDVRAVPMRQQWLHKPPPTVVSVALHDPLHDEGVAYAGLLQGAGAEVSLLDAGDMAHGFLRQCRVNDSARRHVQGATDGLLKFLRATR